MTRYMLRFACHFHHQYGVIRVKRADEWCIKVKLISENDSKATSACLRRRAFERSRWLSWHGSEY